MQMKQFRATKNGRKARASPIVEEKICLNIIFYSQINEEESERSRVTSISQTSTLYKSKHFAKRKIYFLRSGTEGSIIVGTPSG